MTSVEIGTACSHGSWNAMLVCSPTSMTTWIDYCSIARTATSRESLGLWSSPTHHLHSASDRAMTGSNPNRLHKPWLSRTGTALRPQRTPRKTLRHLRTTILSAGHESAIRCYSRIGSHGGHGELERKEMVAGGIDVDLTNQINCAALEGLKKRSFSALRVGRRYRAPVSKVVASSPCGFWAWAAPVWCVK